ncbi:MAG: UDP-N-acetylmuramoyl-tripeptide--D-alanyl-D-alanine ligase [Mangrovibacterium sp.]
MNTNQLYAYFIKYPIVCTDTRAIVPHSIFFALKGANFDGNQYAHTALEQGAAYAVVDDQSLAPNDRLLVVDDVLKSLQDLANYHRKQLALPVLAITGTNGKTTSKELIAAVLSRKFKLCYTKGNLNNHIGVPLTLLGMTADTELAVVEMGANHPGEIAALCAIAEPDFGLITNVGKAHLEGFGSFEGVIRTKCEMYDYLRAHQGKCFVCADNEILMDKSAGLNRSTYGASAMAQVQGEAEASDYQLVVKALFPKGWLYIKTKLIGGYNFENVMAAVAIGSHFAIDPIEIQSAIEAYQPSNNRSQLEVRGTNRIILDAYNANPTSMQGALKNLIGIKHSHKCAILGDMLELGESSAIEHQHIVDVLEAAELDAVFLVGAHFAKTKHSDKMLTFMTSSELANHLKAHVFFEQSLILVKGSRGTKLETVLHAINSEAQ